MGKSSVAMNHYIGKPTKAVDLFNGILFKGQQVMQAEDLEPWKSSSEFILSDKDDKKKPVGRYRDVIFKWKEGPLVALLAVENQSYVNYQMPLRSMLYDALSYQEQAEIMWDKVDPKEVTNNERLSKYQKDSKLMPMITLVFYYDSNEWDGSKDLFGMLDFGDDESMESIIQKYAANYTINLIDANTLEEEKFQTDLRQIIGLIQCRGDKAKMEKYIKDNEEIFKNLEEDTYDAMGAVLGKEDYFAKKKKVDEKGRVDMCPALQGFYDEGRISGIAEGRISGIAEGRLSGIAEGAMQKLKEIASSMLEEGFSLEMIAKITKESVDVLTDLVKELQDEK